MKCPFCKIMGFFFEGGGGGEGEVITLIPGNKNIRNYLAGKCFDSTPRVNVLFREFKAGRRLETGHFLGRLFSL